MAKNNIKWIYIIQSLYLGRFYYWSSNNILSRFKQHKRSLKKWEHRNIFLQRHVDKYWLDDLLFQIVEECDNYVEREQYYLDTYCNWNKESFNIAKVAYWMNQ